MTVRVLALLFGLALIGLVLADADVFGSAPGYVAFVVVVAAMAASLLFGSSTIRSRLGPGARGRVRFRRVRR